MAKMEKNMIEALLARPNSRKAQSAAPRGSPSIATDTTPALKYLSAQLSTLCPPKVHRTASAKQMAYPCHGKVSRGLLKKKLSSNRHTAQMP